VSGLVENMTKIDNIDRLISSKIIWTHLTVLNGGFEGGMEE
jgi:hypothetical protein